jgi:hypothetical protein
MAPTPTLQLHVALNDVKPQIWRRLWVAADTRLDQFHLVLQGAMGWDNCHLHGFRKGKRIYTDEPEPGSNQEDEFHFVLGQLLRKKEDRLQYDYDFGDDWQHTITLEQLFPGLPEESVELPLLIDGANNCPPEDCGGPWGYEDFRKRVEAKDPDTLEWLKATDHPPDWSPQSFDVEMSHLGMLEMIEMDEQALLKSLFEEYEEFAGVPIPKWSPLEQQLVLAQVHKFAQQPRWQEMFDYANQSAIDGITAFSKSDLDPAEQVPGLDALVLDHVAFDLVGENMEPVAQAFLATRPDLSEGALNFLNLMSSSVLAPYQINGVAPNGDLMLIDMIDGIRLSAHFSQPTSDQDFDPDREDLLFARVIPCGDEFKIVGPYLACAFDPEQVDHLLNFLAKGCRAFGGNPEETNELLKPGVPHMIAYWVMQTVAGAGIDFPMTALPGEDWDPGVSIYVIGSETEAKAALDASPDLHAQSDYIWQSVAKPKVAQKEGEKQQAPIGWIILSETHMHIWASGRAAMKEMRRLIKKAKVSRTRHIKTRYGIADEFPISQEVP